MKKTLGIAIAIIGVSIATATVADPAADAVIGMRQALMRSNNQAGIVLIAMLRGQTPYDPVVAAAVATSIAHDNDVVWQLFPDGSDKGTGLDGHPTKATADAFKDKAGFKALSLKMAADAKAAADAAAKGKDAFAAAFKAVGQNCQDCHEKYRAS